MASQNESPKIGPWRKYTFTRWWNKKRPNRECSILRAGQNIVSPKAEVKSCRRVTTRCWSVIGWRHRIVRWERMPLAFLLPRLRGSSYAIREATLLCGWILNRRIKVLELQQSDKCRQSHDCRQSMRVVNFSSREKHQDTVGNETRASNVLCPETREMENNSIDSPSRGQLSLETLLGVIGESTCRLNLLQAPGSDDQCLWSEAWGLH